MKPTFSTPASLSLSVTVVKSWIVTSASGRMNTDLSSRCRNICRSRSASASMRTLSLSSWTIPVRAKSAGTVTYTGCAVTGVARRACGRFTCSPCCIIGAVTMKMISSTSITSTSGTTLISESEVATYPPRPRRPRPDPPESCFCTEGIISRRSTGLREVALGDVQELEREVVHLGGEVLHPVREVVVEIHRRDRREEPRRRRNQRFGDTGGDDRKARGTGGADPLEGDDDAPDGAEQADERRDARGRCQK